MDDYMRHRKIWRLLYISIRPYIDRRFNFSHENICPDGACIVIPNHVTNWDPLLVAMSFPHKQMYFVASEHLFRKGAVTRVINWLVAPISRKKASTGADTVKACLRQLKAGHSVCLFAEGETTWTGVTGDIFPATGKLVRASGASLVTYRIEGGYLSLPRWRKVLARGKMHGGAVNVYSPEQLKKMSASEINEVIKRDIYENAWERQARERVPFPSKRSAEGVHRLLYICPSCRRVGTIRGEGRHIKCSCGFETKLSDTGFLQPSVPFETLADWDKWQINALKEGSFEHGDELFYDDNVTLTSVLSGHSQKKIVTSRLIQREGELAIGDRCFALADIKSMAIIQTALLVFSVGDEYFELKSENDANMKKYRDYIGIFDRER